MYSKFKCRLSCTRGVDSVAFFITVNEQSVSNTDCSFHSSIAFLLPGEDITRIYLLFCVDVPGVSKQGREASDRGEQVHVQHGDQDGQVDHRGRLQAHDQVRGVPHHRQDLDRPQTPPR